MLFPLFQITRRNLDIKRMNNILRNASMSNQKIMDVFSIQSINNMLYLESSPAQNIGGR